jgi:hypothetical protein
MLLKDHLHSLIVLSYGRTGSVLLAANLRNSLVGCRTGNIQYVKTLPYDFSVNNHTVFHTHFMIDQDLIPGITRVFSIRQNFIEHVLSFVMVNQFKHYHIRIIDTPPTLEPFTFKDWEKLDHWLDAINCWYKKSASALNANDLVVSYELFTCNDRAAQDNGWTRMYPDKFKTILNYSEVSDYIMNKMFWQRELDYLLKHKNSFDIYPYTAGSIE